MLTSICLIVGGTTSFKFRPEIKAFDIPSDGAIGALLEATTTRVTIIEVVEGALANIAGIEAGDVILQVDDEDVSDLEIPLESTVELIKSHKPCAVDHFTPLRDEQEIKTDVTTARRSSVPFEEIFPSRFEITPIPPSW